MSDVTIIGLGQMGATLARLLLKAGRSVTVWNRSADKNAPLLALGASPADIAASAIAASPIVVMCLSDYAAADAVLRSPGTSQTIRGRLVINLGTGGPDEVRAAADWFGREEVRYIDGAIQSAPSQMGDPNTPVLVSGARSALEECEAILKIFGGRIIYLGERIDSAAFMDLATLSYVYGAFAGFLHGARIAESVGIDVAELGALVETIGPSFSAFFGHEAKVIQAGDFRVSESPMRISFPAVERILRTSKMLQINADLPALVHGWLERAGKQGLADEELAALIKVLR